MRLSNFFIESLTGVLRAAAHTLPAVALAKCSSRLSDPLKCSSRLLSASHGPAVRIVDASRPKVVVLGNRWRCHMAGELLVTRGLGAEAVEYSKRFQQLAELPLGSDSYLAIATGTVQHAGFSMPKQYRGGDPPCDDHDPLASARSNETELARIGDGVSGAGGSVLRLPAVGAGVNATTRLVVYARQPSWRSAKFRP
jgi:hypothetical protein